jgi:hypothetical protein
MREKKSIHQTLIPILIILVSFTLIFSHGNANTSTITLMNELVTQYNFRVMAGDSSGLTNLVPQASATSIPAPPSPKILGSPYVTASTARITWFDPTSGNIIGYKIEKESPLGGGWSTLVANTGNTTSRYDLSGLDGNTKYNIRISTLYGNSNTSPPSIPYAFYTSPKAPAELKAIQVTPSTIHLSWTAPDDNGTVSGYKIEFSTDGGITWLTTNANTGSSQTTYDHTNLVAGTTYTYRVSAIKQNGVPSVTRVLQMNDISKSKGLSVNNARQIMGEFVSPTSTLVGKPIDTITLQLRKQGSPTGIATVGIFNSDLSVKQSFGTIDVISLAGTYVNHPFVLDSAYPYQIQANDIIGIMYNGGDESNFISAMRDVTNAFDGTNSYRTEHTTHWGDSTSDDMYMILTLNQQTISTKDAFGVGELYPSSLVNQREWYANWNVTAHDLTAINTDPYDPQFVAHGRNDTKIHFFGNGIVNMSGTQPRMYVHDPNFKLKWRNEEVTYYGKRISESSPNSSAGFLIGARSNHLVEVNGTCNVDTYYSRMTYIGGANFKKEINFPDATVSEPVRSALNLGGDGTIPKNTWIGHKLVLRDVDNGTHVRMEMYLDLTDGANGGKWILAANYTDDGNWKIPPEPCGIPRNKILLESNPATFIRNTNINSALYKKWSIREINVVTPPTSAPSNLASFQIQDLSGGSTTLGPTSLKFSTINTLILILVSGLLALTVGIVLYKLIFVKILHPKN